MTPTDIAHDRRVAADEEAIRLNNVSEAAQVFGLARQTVSEWKRFVPKIVVLHRCRTPLLIM